MAVAVSEQEHPKVLEIAERFWTAMESEAKQDDGHLVFTGGIAATFRTLGVSFTYYTKSLALLEDADCVQIVQKGGNGRTSVVVLLQKPTSDLLAPSLTKLVDAAKLAPLEFEQRLGVLERRLGSIDLVEVLSIVEGRLQTLEQQVNELTGGTK